MTDELTQERRDNSADITTYPYSCQERAAIYIYEAGMEEQEADQRAIKEYHDIRGNLAEGSEEEPEDQ